MTDLSDGIAVGLHNLAEASDVSFEAERDALPTLEDTRDEDLYVGEDYELLFTLPQSETDAVRDALKATDTEMTLIGETVEKEDANVRMDGEPLGRRGYEH
jgi:thiamine-monophosphate kinase